MSADNWTRCQECEDKANLARRLFEQKVQDSYGKVPKEEYLRLNEELNKPEKREDTLREDYEIGISGDVFSVSYVAWCTVCGFKYEFKTNQKVLAGRSGGTAPNKRLPLKDKEAVSV